MKRCLVLGALGAASLFAATTASAQTRMSESQARSMLRSWPMSSQKAAADMMRKYGMPNEATPTMLKWMNNGPWKYTIISSRETPHSFPGPHPDVMEQGVDYAVPWNRFDELAQYDGSVIVERTRGEMSARCDQEGANFLAVNLAHDIVTGRRNVTGARTYYARAIDMFKKTGRMDPYMQRLNFTPRPNSGDPDRPAMMPPRRR